MLSYLCHQIMFATLQDSQSCPEQFILDTYCTYVHVWASNNGPQHSFNLQVMWQSHDWHCNLIVQEDKHNITHSLHYSF